jgi:hypothetical protein
MPVDVGHHEAAQKKKQINCKICATKQRQLCLWQKKDIEMERHYGHCGNAAQTVQ